MRTLLVPIGPPGSGKSTLCNGLQQFMTAVSRPVSVANLDPANDNIPYADIAAFDVRELVSVEEIMEREELGPNGGTLWAMEEVQANFEWLESKLEECEETVVLDPPGQAELYTHHMALPRILQRIEKLGYRVVVIQLLDSVVLTRPSLYLSSLLLCVRGMLHLPYPIVNVLTKMDNLKSAGGASLPFNLDFYTEVQDLHHMLPVLANEQAQTLGNSSKFDRLNEALIGLIEDFGLVGFETLAVEDRASMASLIRAIDRASGYVFAGSRATDESGRTLNDEASLWAQAMSDHWGGKMDVRDVQERWIERKEEIDDLETKQWEEEAKMATASPSAQAVRKKAEEATGGGVRGSAAVSSMRHEEGGIEDDDEMMAEQRKWQEEQRREGEAGAARAVRKD